ncbi:hypothetical protein C0585_03750 [Candidatus Woesearchaeota archaeon]|nr:MAG: hypothetical protein C0585_03750 [Candidatus Woesearchaeota archaeon]
MKQEKIIRILKILEKQDYGVSMLAGFGGLDADPFKILIATVLSVRAKDEATIPIVEKLWEKYNTPKKIADANPKDLEEIIRPIGFYNIKTKRIQDLSRKLLDEFNGKVPSEEEELLSLPGVGRKVANCVLVYSFDKYAVPVDVHVHRISNRLGFVTTNNPEETELKLIETIPRKYWKIVNEKMVLLGQNICKPITPICSACQLNKLCEKNNVKRFL